MARAPVADQARRRLVGVAVLAFVGSLLGGSLVAPPPVGAVLGNNLVRTPTGGAVVTFDGGTQYDSATYGFQRVGDDSWAQDGGSWATSGCNQPWVQINWSAAQTLTTVNIWSRSGGDPFGNAGTLTTSDSASIPFASYPPVGQTATPMTFTFAAAHTVTWIRLTSTGGCGGNGGLAEVQAFLDSAISGGGGAGSGSGGGTAGTPGGVGSGGSELGGATGSMVGKSIYGKAYSADPKSDLSTAGGCAPNGPLSGDPGKPLLCLLAIDQCVAPTVALDVPGWLSYVWCELRNLPRHIINGLLTMVNVLIDLAIPCNCWGTRIMNQVEAQAGAPGASGAASGLLNLGAGSGITMPGTVTLPWGSVNLWAAVSSTMAPARPVLGAMMYGLLALWAWGVWKTRGLRQTDSLMGVDEAGGI